MVSLIIMETINIQAAKTHLSKLLEKVARGEEIILAKAGQPVARLVPYSASRNARKGGQLKGRVVERADCWSAPEDAFGDALDSELYHSAEPSQAPLKVAEGRGA